MGENVSGLLLEEPSCRAVSFFLGCGRHVTSHAAVLKFHVDLEYDATTFACVFLHSTYM